MSQFSIIWRTASARTTHEDLHHSVTAFPNPVCHLCGRSQSDITLSPASIHRSFVCWGMPLLHLVTRGPVHMLRAGVAAAYFRQIGNCRRVLSFSRLDTLAAMRSWTAAKRYLGDHCKLAHQINFLVPYRSSFRAAWSRKPTPDHGAWS